MIALETQDININYGDKSILKKVNIEIQSGKIVTIIGPNGSGKSTLLKAISGYLKPLSGQINLNGVNIKSLKKKEMAKKMAVLPQIKDVPSDITVENLVSYGRYPHLSFRKRFSNKDKSIVQWAIEKTGLKEYKDRYINTLSGGERQRAWIAMALAQKPKIVLLDEPTTYLDISYQLEVLEIVKELNVNLNLTVVMVLHDLNQAARYSDYIYVLNEGRVYSHGKPENIIKADLLKNIFKIQAHIYEDKINKCPYFIPHKIV